MINLQVTVDVRDDRRLEESAGPQVTPGTGNFGAFPELAKRIGEDYDFDAVRQQREYDLLHAHDHVP